MISDSNDNIEIGKPDLPSSPGNMNPLNLSSPYIPRPSGFRFSIDERKLDWPYILSQTLGHKKVEAEDALRWFSSQTPDGIVYATSVEDGFVVDLAIVFRNDTGIYIYKTMNGKVNVECITPTH